MTEDNDTTKVFTVRNVDNDTAAIIDAQALALGMSRESYLRMIVHALAKHGAPLPGRILTHVFSYAAQKDDV